MKRLPRILLVLSSLLLGAMFFLPLWYIGLEAPQYPEGISLYIKLRSVVGGGEFDLAKVNMLNHYIGMKAIDNASIPELRYMPWIVGVLIVTGLLAAWSGKFKALVAWVVAFGVVALVGLADFYRWGYDYGHNLAPDAIIKIPGMTYQPPLIGTKQLLNFTAHSWPATGGIAAGLALFLAAVAVLIAMRGKRRAAAIAAAGILAAACAPRASKLEMSFDGQSSCAYCRMAITDSRVGGVVLTATGKKYEFDAVDCLASFAASNKVPANQIWVLDFEHPGVLLPVSNAAFVTPPDGVSTGMAGTLVAVAAEKAAKGSEARRWSQVVASSAHELQQPAGVGVP